MHPIGIVTIVVAVAIVAGVIVASIVRKARVSLRSEAIVRDARTQGSATGIVARKTRTSIGRNSLKSVRRNSKSSAKKPRNRTMIHNPPTTISSTSH